MVRTRSAATALAEAGYVRVNGAKVKPSHSLRIGDVVTVALNSVVKVMRVEGISDRRTDAERARALYVVVSRV